ncbi:hypothetical protein D3C80_1166820 [compost metagenome]
MQVGAVLAEAEAGRQFGGAVGGQAVGHDGHRARLGDQGATGDGSSGLDVGGLGVRGQADHQDAVPAADAVQAKGLAGLVVKPGGGQGGGDRLAHGGRQGGAACGQISLSAQRQDQGARGLAGRGGEGHGALHGRGGAGRQGGGRFGAGRTTRLGLGGQGDAEADGGQSSSGGEGREIGSAAHRSEPPRCR